MGKELQALIGTVSYVLLGAAVVVAVATVRLIHNGRQHFQEARRFIDSGARDRAVASLEDAAKAYVPGSPYTKRAIRELAIMARAAEMRGELDRAAAIWEVLRRSILATRHFYQPNSPALETAERAIKRLAWERSPESPGEELMDRPKDPSPLASLLLFISLLSWIGGASAIALKPTHKDGRPLVARTYAWSACLGGLCMWLVMAWVI